MKLEELAQSVPCTIEELKLFLSSLLQRLSAPPELIAAAPQGSAEWLSFRLHRLTGSNFAESVGLGFKSSPKSFIKTFLHPSTFRSPAMLHGIEYEDRARQDWLAWLKEKLRKRAEQLGKPCPEVVLDRPNLCVVPEYPILGVSPDGILRKIEGLSPEWGELYERYGRGDILLEIKCPTPAKRHYDSIPRYYYCQVIGSVALLGLVGAEFVVWQPDSFRVRYFMPDDKFWAEFLLPAMLRWYFLEMVPAMVYEHFHPPPPEPMPIMISSIPHGYAACHLDISDMANPPPPPQPSFTVPHPAAEYRPCHLNF